MNDEKTEGTMDYRTMYDRDYLGAWDLPRDVTVTIAKVEGRKLRNGSSKANSKPVLFFKGKEKGMACNKTNGKTIAAMYGTDVDKWIGKRITLYATTTTFGSDTVECIRVRPGVPRGPADETPTPPPVADAETTEEGQA
jgi:hypothetical protein